MKARIIIQIFEDGQKNVSFSQDPDAKLSDFLVSTERPSRAIQGEVFIVADDPELEQVLLETELRSVDNIGDIVPNLGVV